MQWAKKQLRSTTDFSRPERLRSVQPTAILRRSGFFLVAGGTDGCGAALLLGLRQSRSDLVKHGQVLADISLRVLHGNGPLLVPPVGLSEHAAVDHRKPILSPQINIDGSPVAIVADFLGIEHQRAV